VSQLVSELGLDFTGYCSLHDGERTKPATMMEHLFARQTEELKAEQEEIEARRGKEDAEAKARREQLKEDTKGYMEAVLEGLRSCGNRTTACQVSSVSCP
jgi:Skp family chaperone for outer membrane proteins